jgi:hypothetical protein
VLVVVAAELTQVQAAWVVLAAVATPTTVTVVRTQAAAVLEEVMAHLAVLVVVESFCSGIQTLSAHWHLSAWV